MCINNIITYKDWKKLENWKYIKFSDKQWDTIIKTIDKNGDNEIEYDEFKDMMLLFLGEAA